MSTEASGLLGAEERELQVRAALAHMLSSRIFQSSPLLARLLTFLVEEDLAGSASSLKETYIGHVVYGRPATYDPKVDSVVRVNATRLRSRLLDYYAHHPDASPRIVMRPGSYVPVYEFGASSVTLVNLPGPQATDAQPANNGIARRGDLGASPEETAERLRFEATISLGPGKSPIASRQPLAPAIPAPERVSTPSPQAPEQTSSSSRWVSRHRLALASFVVMGVLLVAVIHYFPGRNSQRPGQWTAGPFSNLGGIEEFAEISPAGDQLIFSWKAPSSAHPYIYVRALTGQTPRRLTSINDMDESRPVWSPDGSSIAFLRVSAPGKAQIFVKSLLSGSEIKVADLHGTYPWLCTIPRLSWTHDGKKILTSDRVGAGEACGVVSINIATGSVQPITQPPPGSIGDLEAAVSPDGRQVAFLRNAGTLGGDVYVTSINGGPVRRITFDNRDIMGFCWFSNGSGFVVSSRRVDGVPRLWQASLDGKSIKAMTDGLTLAAFPSMTRQGDRIVFTTYRTTMSIWQVSDGSSKPLISDQSGNSTPQLSPDGTRLLYRSDRTGAFELWLSKLDGQNGVQLTDFKGPMVNNPRWSPDGKQIVFECRPRGQSDICVMPVQDPAQVHVLTDWASNEIFPSWSHDGKTIYFTSNYSGRWEIYQQSAAGGDPVVITHNGGMRALESEDGHWLYIFRDEEPRSVARIATSERADHSWEAGEPKIVWSNFAPDLVGRWDTSSNGVIYLSPSAADSNAQEKIIAIDGNTTVHREIGVVAGPSPAGDLIFSAAGTQSFVYVRQGLKEGDLGLLLFEPARR